MRILLFLAAALACAPPAPAVAQGLEKCRLRPGGLCIGMDLRNAQLRGADLREALLEGADLTAAETYGCRGCPR